MYLKIRDVEKGCWLYISGFDRIEAFDKVHHSDLTWAPEDEVCELTDVHLEKFGADVSVLDLSKLRQGDMMYLNCLVDEKNDKGEQVQTTLKKVAFNTYAFLCNDRGDTMDRFIVNKYNHARKLPCQQAKSA